MAAAICGHLRLKGEAAKLRGRRICCSFGDESLTIKGEVSTFLAVQRSAFGENWRQRGNVLKPTLVAPFWLKLGTFYIVGHGASL